MCELGENQLVTEDCKIELYHVHTIKSYDDVEWELKQTINTNDFCRKPSCNLQKRIREDMFEKVRSEKYNHLPSRKTCLFASMSLESAKDWCIHLGGRKQLCKIRLILGKYAIFDEEIYENRVFVNDVMNADANNYWSGLKCEDNNKLKRTVLFEGIFQIEKVINSEDNF